MHNTSLTAGHHVGGRSAVPPLLDIHPPAWQTVAACRERDDVDFFPAAHNLAGTRAAVAICQQCPARRACLDFALANESRAKLFSRWGIYGGLTPAQRWEAHKRRQKERNARAED